MELSGEGVRYYKKGVIWPSKRNKKYTAVPV